MNEIFRFVAACKPHEKESPEQSAKCKSSCAGTFIADVGISLLRVVLHVGFHATQLEMKAKLLLPVSFTPDILLNGFWHSET